MNKRSFKNRIFSLLFAAGIILLTAAWTTAQDIAIDDTNFPDDNFRNYLLSQPYGSDALLTPAEIAEVTQMDVYNLTISDLTGIGYFTALTDLDCGNNQIQTLDVSANTALQGLNCSNNQLASLNLPANTALQTLWCQNNQLTALDVSAYTALTELYCNTNQLTSLDVSANTALTSLDCSNNQIQTLDVSANTALQRLVCNDNQLNVLDVSSNTALQGLNCSYNQLTSLNVPSNTSLTVLDCSYNQLTSLDLSNDTEFSVLFCFNNQLTALDLSSNTSLTVLDCSYNQLTSLDLSNNTALTNLYCPNNHLTSLDLTENIALTDFFGEDQTPSLTLANAGGSSYSSSISLNSPTGLVSGISYSAGTLTSTDNTITSTPFTVETNQADYQLSGTLTLNYPEATPAAAIDYINETLTGLSGSYTINGAAVTVTGPNAIAAGWFGKTVSIVKKGNGTTTTDSDPQNLAIPARPARPSGVSGVNVSVTGLNDGEIIGVTSAMEYSADHTTWTACPNGDLTGLAAGTYYVRFKATATAFKGLTLSIVIEKDVIQTQILDVSAPVFETQPAGYARPAAQALTITNSGNSDATISSVTVSNNYIFEIIKGTATVASCGTNTTWQIRPRAGLEAATYFVIVTVTYDGNATATAAVRFTVTAAVGTEQVGQATGLKVWVINGNLHVSGLTAGKPLKIYNLTGALIYSATAAGDEATVLLPGRGMYIVQSEGRTVKAVN